VVELLPRGRTDTAGHIYQFSHRDLWNKHDFAERCPDFAGVREYFKYVDERLDLTKDIELLVLAALSVSTWRRQVLLPSDRASARFR
jgi:hypothetical protein